MLSRVTRCIPEFWGFVLDEGKKLVDAPAFSDRKIEFIGNSITCGYGNEGLKKEEHFDYATENHYYSYASITARNLDAQHWVVARSGIGAYRNYNGPRTGNPESNMLVQYEYIGYAWKPELRKEASFLREKLGLRSLSARCVSASTLAPTIPRPTTTT